MKYFELDLTALDAIRRRMGAKLTNHEFKDVRLPPMDAPINKELRKGIDENLDKIPTQDGFFIHKGQQIVIYIKDHTFIGRDEIINNPKIGRRVHLYDCETITSMKRKRRFDRYRQTARIDNKYLIDVKGRQSLDVKLYPCRKCLRALDYKEFRAKPADSQIEFLDSFDLEEFFGVYSTFFARKPEHSDITAPHSDYPKDWDRISRKKKESEGWVCSKCGVNLSSSAHQKYLHVCHINGVKSDVGDDNLRCLCIFCHAKRFFHEAMKAEAREHEELIRQLRREQGLE